jgi:hypothetical protein
LSIGYDREVSRLPDSMRILVALEGLLMVGLPQPPAWTGMALWGVPEIYPILMIFPSENAEASHKITKIHKRTPHTHTRS